MRFELPLHFKKHFKMFTYVVDRFGFIFLVTQLPFGLLFLFRHRPDFAQCCRNGCRWEVSGLFALGEQSGKPPPEPSDGFDGLPDRARHPFSFALEFVNDCFTLL